MQEGNGKDRGVGTTTEDRKIVDDKFGRLSFGFKL